MNMRECLIFLLLALASPWLYGQEPEGPANTLEELQARYESRIGLTHINEVYIPMDVDDAMRELDRITSESAKESYKNATEELILEKLFFKLGKWMIINWGFEEGSRLAHEMRKTGIYHPDDMAKVLMVCYYRHLNELPRDYDLEVKKIKERINNEQLERIRTGTILHEERRPAKKQED